MAKHYFEELPAGYKLVKTIDAKKTKTAVLFTLANFAVVIALVALFWLIKRYKFNVTEDDMNKVLIMYLLFLTSFVAYIILHELTHGLVYKLFTHQKLTFGLTLAVAFCGVPKIYCKRKCSIYALLAPFVTFSVLLLPFVIILDGIPGFFVMILFSLHIGGCVGDLYNTFLLMFKLKDKDILIRDTGPKQMFYIKDTTD